MKHGIHSQAVQMQVANVCVSRKMSEDSTPAIIKTAEEICAYSTICAGE